jgi:hypothetical protein
MSGAHNNKKRGQLEAVRHDFQPPLDTNATKEGMFTADGFPDNLWTFHFPHTNQFFFLTLPGKGDGLPAMSARSLADELIEILAETNQDFAKGCVPFHLTFDEARQIAIAGNSDALFLMDHPEEIKVHYVR